MFMFGVCDLIATYEGVNDLFPSFRTVNCFYLSLNFLLIAIIYYLRCGFRGPPVYTPRKDGRIFSERLGICISDFFKVI
jgi:hypothetical protein